MMSRQRAVQCQDDVAAIQRIRHFIPFGFGLDADGKAEGQAIGIAWDQRFGKDDELCPIPAGLLDLMDDFLQRRLFIEEYRRSLHDSGA